VYSGKAPSFPGQLCSECWPKSQLGRAWTALHQLIPFSKHDPSCPFFPMITQMTRSALGHATRISMMMGDMPEGMKCTCGLQRIWDAIDKIEEEIGG
jgi:hypothetical protein